MRHALESEIAFDHENLKLRQQTRRSKQGLSTDTVSAVTKFQMSACAERLASHSRNSLSKTESTPNRDRWQESNFWLNRFGTVQELSLVLHSTKAALIGRPLYI